VQQGIYFGVILFITSEIMFFFSFFWSFFHISLSPNIFIGLIWPPEYINLLDCYSLPLLNTIILLASGVTVTYAHKACIAGSRLLTLDGL
jgi:cytochrome c oxidase subunit 3